MAVRGRHASTYPAGLGLLAVLGGLWFGRSCAAAPLADPAVDAYNVHVGTQTFAGLYQFTTNTLLLETAQAIRSMGCDVIKLYLGNNYSRQYRYALAPNVTNLVSLVRDDPSCHRVFDMPFRNIIAWVYPFGNGDAPFTDGKYSTTEQADDYREIYGLTQYLLTNYNNSAKTFYLGHWEGDGYLNVNGWTTNPSPAVIQAMIDWENNRQKAVDDAKAGVAFTNVNVFYYAEANRVRDAMVNGPTNNQRVINMVVPYVTNLDYLSYSSYDAMNLDSASLYATLDYLKSKLPAEKANASLGQRIWIGEYGWGGWSTAAQEPANRAYIQRLLNWGPRFILFWEIYNNETNRNFCLIDSNGAKVDSYYLHQRFINQARLSVARFRESNARLPNDTEFAALMSPLLNQPLPAPVNLSLSNLPATVSNGTAQLTGQLAQGLYGDDQATVWVFWGRQDAGTNRSHWEAGRMLGINTNFNPATFSATVEGLAAQTNYFFRFYATNASGEAWAPVSAQFSTATLQPADYGSRLRIQFPGYNRSQGLADFPVLVQLGTNVPGFNYSGFASADGGDLRFTDSDGTRLIPHEIDHWNSGGTSWVWVRVPELSATNVIWAYWGNPGATNAPAWTTNGAVWAPQAQTVWHLQEPGLPYRDSCAQHPVLSGTAPAPTTGTIGQGVSFNGSSEYLDAGVINLNPTLTLSAWVRIDPGANGIQTICANKPGGWNSDGLALYVNTYQTSDHKLLLETGNGTTGTTAATAAEVVTPGVWHQVAAVIDVTAGSARLYVDGVDRTQSSSLQNDFGTGADFNIGRFTDGTFYFTGQMDEVRVEQGARSGDWLWAEWQCGVPNGGLCDYASVNVQPVLLGLSINGSGALASWAGAGVGLSLYMATNLAEPIQWRRLTNLPAWSADAWQVHLPPPASNGASYFRLQEP